VTPHLQGFASVVWKVSHRVIQTGGINLNVVIDDHRIHKECFLLDKNKVAVVTGANFGMGKIISIELAKLGAVVVMLCRNKARGEEALHDVRALSGNKSVDLMLCDLGSNKKYRTFL
jgi:hypothetical protein